MTWKIAVVTGCRSEYHLLTPLLRRLSDADDIDLDLVVTGAHLDERQGMTVHAIEDDGFPIKLRIPITANAKTASDIDKALSEELLGFDAYLSDARPDLVVLLGDRYEILSVAIAAMMHRIPIAHIHGGEVTEGAVDDSIRHAVTKMSTLHFTSCQAHRNRVIQLGENPAHVFDVGACGVENIRTCKLMDREDFFEDVGLNPDHPFFLITYHPTTLGNLEPVDEIDALFCALARHRDHSFLFTCANADAGGVIINRELAEYAAAHDDAVLVPSLGLRRYLTALSLADAVIGNSSSGLLEAPSFGVPTINIGDRQKGRMQAASVISCPIEASAISDAIVQAVSPKFRAVAATAKNPYGDGHASEKIMAEIRRYLGQPCKEAGKPFYDIEFNGR
jgi:GDP/UDP-N,N'-diacetylbacillosamine 2-epimerase (hydrolysing)